MTREKKGSKRATVAVEVGKRVRLGDVTPGNWAQLPSGEEVRVSWHSKRCTLVRRSVPVTPEEKYSQPDDMDSDTLVIERPRVVDYVDDGVVQDPLGGLS